MAAAQRALVTGAGAAEPRVIARSGERPGQQGCLGRCSSLASVPRRRVQLGSRRATNSAGACLPRAGQLKVSRVNKDLRSSSKLANAFVSGPTFGTKHPWGRSRRSFIYAGFAAGSGTADESREADLSSSLQKIVAPALDIGFSTGTRTVTITVCGVTNENDLRRLKSQVEDVDGVGNAWLGPLKEGGVRGGSVTLHTEVEKRVPLPALIRSVQALDDALLILPFKSNSWLWRGNKINYSVSGCGKPLILVHGFGGNVGHFARLIPFLAESHQVYAIDLLGFGASDKPSNVEYGPDMWAELICGPRPEVMVPKINVPVLLLWGEKDPWTPANGPIAKIFRKVAAERDNAVVKILPDVGHCPHDDRPELAAGEILPFLEKYGL